MDFHKNFTHSTPECRNYTAMKDLEGWKDVPQSLYKEILDKCNERDHKILLLESKILAPAPLSLNQTAPVIVPLPRPAH